MPIQLLFFAVVFMASAAEADQLYVRVTVACASKQLLVSMESAWNSDGERLAQERRAGPSWDTSELVEFSLDEQGRHQVVARPRRVKCVLGKRSYTVDVEPSLAPGFQPEGWCATRVGASITLRAGSRVKFRGGTDACTEEGDVPTRIETLGDGTLKVKRVPARVFLEPK